MSEANSIPEAVKNLQNLDENLNKRRLFAK